MMNNNALIGEFDQQTTGPFSIEKQRIWKTICPDQMLECPKNYLTALTRAKMKADDHAMRVLNESSFSSAEVDKRSISFINISVGDLGFLEDTPLIEIYQYALEVGLRECPVDLGFALRILYAEQPDNELLFAITPLVSTKDNTIELYVIICDNSGKWIRAVSYGLNQSIPIHARMIFVHPL